MSIEELAKTALIMSRGGMPLADAIEVLTPIQELRDCLMTRCEDIVLNALCAAKQ